MNKRLVRRLLTLLLTALLLAGLQPSAQAAPIEKTYTVRLADGIDEEIPSPDGSWIDDVVLVSGELPYGVVIGHHENIMYIIGVPAYAGTYEARVDMEIGGGAYQYLIRIVVKDPNAPVAITKHPTGEEVTEGGSAVFIARADNATEIVWRLVSPDAATTYNCSDAPYYFPGLEVYGLGTDTLSLVNIPLSLDGWKVEAKFLGVGGPVYSKGALLTVNRAQLPAPVISVQPQGAEAETGTPVTLSVSATAPEGTLYYQWYRAEDSTAAGTAIPDANSPTLTVTDAMGTGYYYVGVWCADGEIASQLTVSQLAYVRFTAPSPTPVPVTPAPEGAGTPQEAANPFPAAQTARTSSSSGALLAVLLVVGLLALAGVCVCLILILRRKNQS